MTLDEVKNYFHTGYQLKKETGMSYNNISNWQKMGWVPLLSQVKIQKLTNGALVARFEDVGAKNG